MGKGREILDMWHICVLCIHTSTMTIRGSSRQGLDNVTLLFSAVYFYCRAHETKLRMLYFSLSKKNKGGIDTNEKVVEL